MNQFLSAPVTDAQRQRDALLGALVGLARSTVNEPKTEDTDRVLTSGLRLAADPDARAAPDVPHRRDGKALRRPQLRHLHHALRQHRQLRPRPALGRAGGHPRPQTAAAGSSIPAGTGPPGRLRTGGHRPGPFCSRRRLGRGTSRPRREASRGLLCRVNSPEISAFPRALHFFSLRCAAHKSGQFLFYRAFFPLFVGI